MATEDLSITISVDADGAITATGELSQELDNLSDSAQQAGTETEKTSGTLSRLATAAKSKALVIGALAAASYGAAKSIVALADAGEKLGSLRQGFEDLGGTADAIEKARQASLGMIKEVDLLAIANRGLLMGLPDINENFGKIADAGTRLANILGGDATQMTRQLTEAIARGRTMQLQQLGIIIDQEAAYRDYARQLGVTVEELSKLQRQEAMQVASLKAVEEFLDNTTEAADSVSNSYAALQTSMSNAFAEVGIAINENEQLAQSLRALADVIHENIDALAALANFLATTVAVAMQTTAQLVNAARSAWHLLNADIAAAAGAADDFRQRWTGAAREIEQTGNAVQRSGVNMVNVVERVSNSASSMWDSFKADDRVQAGARAVTEAWGSIQKQADDTAKTITKASNEIEKSSKEVAKAVDVQKDAFEDLKQVIDDLTGQSARSRGMVQLRQDMQDLIKEQGSATLETSKMAEALKKLADDFKAAGGSAKDFESVLRDTQRELNNLDDTGVDRLLSAVNQLGSAFTRTGGDVRSLASELGSMAGGAIGSMVGGPIGGRIGAQASGFIIDTLLSRIGSREPGRLARNAIEDSLNQAIKDRPIQIRLDGQLVDFSGLDWQQYFYELNEEIANSSFIHTVPPGFQESFLQKPVDFDAWQREIVESAPEIHSIFQSIFGPLAMMMEETFAHGAQVATMMMAEMGGSIDNLRLLVKTLDLDFEQLRDQIVEAFYRGEISALEAASMMRDLPEAFKPGREAFNDITGAADDLIESAGRGVVAWKAFQDLAVEAEQGGAQSLSDLRQQLLDTGRYTERQIEQIFSALEQNGVTSLEQLATISKDAVIPVLGALEAYGDFFEDVTQGFDGAAEKARGLEESLNRLDRISAEANLTINVSTRYRDAGAETALGQVDRQGAGFSA